MKQIVFAGLCVCAATSSIATEVRQAAGQEEGRVEASQSTVQPPELNPEAPAETAHLAQLVGLWEASLVQRNRDGSWQDQATRYLWRWYFILDGHALQDDWISIEEGEHRVIGTNIRIYDPDTAQWHMAWIDSVNRRLATFNAVHDGDSVVMSGHNAQGRLVRNTFSAITVDSFEWTQEWTFDEGETWFTVVKTSCRRRN
jgi:hypothetical protein